MATEGGNKVENGVGTRKQPNRSLWLVPLLRVVAFLATAVATIVMALDKQTKSFVVATIGTTPITATLTAKFNHTPAFVFFVIVNSMACLHNLVMLLLEFFGSMFDRKGILYVIIPILDMMMVALVSAGGGGAFWMGELGRKGNSHARWNKICDKFTTFCNQALWAIVASFIGLLFLMTVNTIAILKLRNQKAVI